MRYERERIAVQIPVELAVHGETLVAQYEAAATMGESIAGMEHDFNLLLNSIRLEL